MEQKQNNFKVFNSKGLITLLLILVFNLGHFGVKAQALKEQEKQIEQAKTCYLNKEYSKTIEICNRILSVEPETNIAHLLLAEVYKNLDSVKLEIFHLYKSSEISNDTLTYFKLGEAYYKTGNYSEALNYYNKYSAYKYIPEKRQFLLACKIASCKFTMYSIKNPLEFNLQNDSDPINTPNYEYWPKPSPDGSKLIFTKVREDSTQLLKEDSFISEMDSDNVKKALPVIEVNTSGNGGAQTLKDDSKILFFTACNQPDGKGSCDIYYSRFINEEWNKPVNGGNTLNSKFWDAQPSFSTDNRYLYFSSNRPGGVGKKDIWRAELLGFSDTGALIWKEPENLGDIINTPGDEISPFIYKNNMNFYFASDGHVGMGGIDLFSAEIDNYGSANNLKNLGYPINTEKNEFGLTISSIAETYYFSAARNSEKGLLIFTVNLSKALNPNPFSYVEANITDGGSKLPIKADIELVDFSSKPSQYRYENADENGQVMLCMSIGRNYLLNVSEPGYLFFTKSFRMTDANTLSDPYVLDIELEPIEIGAEIDLYNIYYETDSYTILPQSEQGLRKLVSFLENNSEVKVEIQGHTDNTGNPESNMELSRLRAKSLVDYLISNNIAISRLKYAGYGDTLPIESNETASGRQLNRRTTVKILDN